MIGPILVVIILMNIFGFIVMGMDKRRAKRQKWRISERTIWLTALLGGALGITIGMYVFRHKTKHLSFKLGLPFLIVAQFACFLYLSMF
ncbi:DUF1294 domain-containing protein [Fervidibacillus halotolerans]|uniref:DUF1294 domain-containing protein n=1 Tax=Fervidibacillus halotolerans TaxID=2980027 RepID=A0A9E8RZH3_9BACI|nr:DUF1294 domain-containing protein [Fervidibacillus halotolerans]WAA11642.1 DUF1294 domain-containing protein [Fervidibacillus halotolerans]